MAGSIVRNLFLNDPGNWKFWVGVGLLFKVSLFVFKVFDSPHDLPGFVGSVGGDTESYLAPVENLIKNGVYDPDFRMPGYALFYYPLRLIFLKSVACNVLIVLQVCAASVAVYILALSARNIFASVSMFYIVFYTYGISSYANLFDHYLLTDSFCTSILIFSVYFLSQYTITHKFPAIFWSGFLLALAIFLRPVYAPFLLVFTGTVVYDHVRRSDSVMVMIKSVTLFVVPFLVADTVWTVRNYVVKREFIPLTTFYYPEFSDTYIPEMIEFVGAWGGERSWWSPTAEIRWFGVGQVRNGPHPGSNIELPSYIYTSKFNLDSLKKVRSYIGEITNGDPTSETSRAYIDYIKRTLPVYTRSIRVEKPILYYAGAPLMLTRKYLFHSGTYNLFNRPYTALSRLELMIKIAYSIFYIATIVAGLAGLVVMIKNLREPMVIVPFLIITYSIILFTFVLRQIEFRYFVPAYPFMTVSACYFIFSLTLQRHRQNSRQS